MMVFASRIYTLKELTVPVMATEWSLVNWSCLTILTSNFFLTTINCPYFQQVKHYRRQLWHCFLNQLMVCECYKIVTQIYFLNVMLYKMIMWCVQNMVKSASGSNCVKSLIHNINSFKIHSLLPLYLELSVQLIKENCLI